MRQKLVNNKKSICKEDIELEGREHEEVKA